MQKELILKPHLLQSESFAIDCRQELNSSTKFYSIDIWEISVIHAWQA